MKKLLPIFGIVSLITFSITSVAAFSVLQKQKKKNKTIKAKGPFVNKISGQGSDYKFIWEVNINKEAWNYFINDFLKQNIQNKTKTLAYFMQFLNDGDFSTGGDDDFKMPLYDGYKKFFNWNDRFETHMNSFGSWTDNYTLTIDGMMAGQDRWKFESAVRDGVKNLKSDYSYINFAVNWIFHSDGLFGKTYYKTNSMTYKYF